MKKPDIDWKTIENYVYSYTASEEYFLGRRKTWFKVGLGVGVLVGAAIFGKKYKAITVPLAVLITTTRAAQIIWSDEFELMQRDKRMRDVLDMLAKPPPPDSSSEDPNKSKLN